MFPPYNLASFRSPEWEALRKLLVKILAKTKSWVASSTAFMVLAGGVVMTVGK